MNHPLSMVQCSPEAWAIRSGRIEHVRDVFKHTKWREALAAMQWKGGRRGKVNLLETPKAGEKADDPGV